jgi:hypothetical protein
MRSGKTITVFAIASWLALCTSRAMSQERYDAGSLLVGPTGHSNFNWFVNNAQGTAGPLPDANYHVSGWDLISVQYLPKRGGGLTSGDVFWTATNQPGQQFNFALITLLNPTTVGNDVYGPMSKFDPSKAYVWPMISWVGTYTGPTDDETLTASTVFDFTNFANPHTQGFVIHYDGANNQIDLVYGNAVPEPGTFALTALGLLAAWRCRRRKRARAVAAAGRID